MDVTHSASSGAQGWQEKLVKDGVQGLDGVYRATCSTLIGEQHMGAAYQAWRCLASA